MAFTSAMRASGGPCGLGTYIGAEAFLTR